MCHILFLPCQIIINFAMFLEENKHFEESFTAYERGVALFKWPVVFEIWNTYLVRHEVTARHRFYKPSAINR